VPHQCPLCPSLGPVADRRRLIATDRLHADDKAGRLSGTPVTLVRHADARDRRGWPGDDDLRPLSALGVPEGGGQVALCGCEVGVHRS
jgi:hypothetical protein